MPDPSSSESKVVAAGRNWTVASTRSSSLARYCSSAFAAALELDGRCGLLRKAEGIPQVLHPRGDADAAPDPRSGGIRHACKCQTAEAALRLGDAALQYRESADARR